MVSILRRRWVVMLGLLVCMGKAKALVQEVTAEFRPNPSNPSSNEFVNTTPQSGVCPWHIPSVCQALGIFSIRTNDLTAMSRGPINADHSDPRQGAMWRVPSEWRDVQVTHRDTGRTATVQFRMAGIGHRWDLRPASSVWDRPVGSGTWREFWRNAPAPCRSTGYAATAVTWALFFWIVPEGPGVCNRVPTTQITSMWYSLTEYAYAIRTPNPLNMASGLYTGTITYSVGSGGDLDFGDVMVPNDNVLTFNFTLDVDHHLNVEVPPGGNRILLEPQGGWQAWLHNGRKPSRLFRDQTVNLWTSSAFKMTLECPEPMGNTCSLRNAAGHQVPLEVAVSLPPGLTDAGGRAVNRLPLRLDGSGTELFEPSRYIDRKPSTLHFEVKADGVAQMLEQAGSTYSGTVTVVWDSEV
ncbi:hypothetical protein PSH87_05630 [Pseudomonas sp. FP453]|nr:hypothetical protein [Pseudomonas sp. FP453]WLH91474.1 hypothetical protein PSH87_05630 [Pseudomonas sp. FP453]